MAVLIHLYPATLQNASFYEQILQFHVEINIVNAWDSTEWNRTVNIHVLYFYFHFKIVCWLPEVEENFALLSYNAVSGGNFLPAFQDNLSALSSGGWPPWR